ncbi:hypothetical protein NliqN6_3028 [Naganishia liquefaciens]|uniref:FAM50A/XAP5 C-terminal domain-containing protein n=1 Tax=Naganishia liquefaciens TaxID=104408 RepID=A0A8H3TSH8_9TREE|nr:hypothetical protein NliqN6_3028 [Naganishia liquefaciens]
MAMNPGEALRQGMLEKQRQQAHEEFQRQKEAIARETERKGASAAERFTARTEGAAEKLAKSTIGLVTLDEFRRTRDEIEESQRMEAAQKQSADLASANKKKKEKKKKEKAKLSFAFDGEDEEEDVGPKSSDKKRSNEDSDEAASAKKLKSMKNPAVDTSFLPDREREERERIEREELRKEWLARQDKMKKETIEITYSYWDGSGHRSSVECKKGDNIGAFLEKCRAQFPELRGISVDNLMYIKANLIIPHHYTFYDFIVNKARGKSGPLFNFDVHDDVRLLHDATKERDESHAGKVVERSWYQRSKHIFPASRWEVYDPDKDYGAYKIA